MKRVMYTGLLLSNLGFACFNAHYGNPALCVFSFGAFVMMVSCWEGVQ